MEYKGNDKLKKFQKATELTKTQLEKSKPKYPLKKTVENVQKKTEIKRYRNVKKKSNKMPKTAYMLD